MNEEKTTLHTPSAWFFRDALNNAKNKAETRRIGLAAARELEPLKEWIREQGAVSPKLTVLRTEAVTKGWIDPEAVAAEIVPIR